MEDRPAVSELRTSIFYFYINESPQPPEHGGGKLLDLDVALRAALPAGEGADVRGVHVDLPWS